MHGLDKHRRRVASRALLAAVAQGVHGSNANGDVRVDGSGTRSGRGALGSTAAAPRGCPPAGNETTQAWEARQQMKAVKTRAAAFVGLHVLGLGIALLLWRFA